MIRRFRLSFLLSQNARHCSTTHNNEWHERLGNIETSLSKVQSQMTKKSEDLHKELGNNCQASASMNLEQQLEIFLQRYGESMEAYKKAERNMNAARERRIAEKHSKASVDAFVDAVNTCHNARCAVNAMETTAYTQVSPLIQKELCAHIQAYQTEKDALLRDLDKVKREKQKSIRWKWEDITQRFQQVKSSIMATFALCLLVFVGIQLVLYNARWTDSIKEKELADSRNRIGRLEDDVDSATRRVLVNQVSLTHAAAAAAVVSTSKEQQQQQPGSGRLSHMLDAASKTLGWFGF